MEEIVDYPESVAQVPLTVYWWARTPDVSKRWKELLCGRTFTISGKTIQFDLIRGYGLDLCVEMEKEESDHPQLKILLNYQKIHALYFEPAGSLPEILENRAKEPRNYEKMLTCPGPNNHGLILVRDGPYFDENSGPVDYFRTFWGRPEEFIYKSAIIVGAGLEYFGPEIIDDFYESLVDMEEK